MLKHLALALPAADGAPSAPSVLNSTGIQGVIAFAVFLVLSLIALKLMSKSDKGDVKGATNTGIVVIIACVILSLAAASLWMSIGSGILTTLFKG